MPIRVKKIFRFDKNHDQKIRTNPRSVIPFMNSSWENSQFRFMNTFATQVFKVKSHLTLIGTSYEIKKNVHL